jgi:2,3,4,5-tetrahydropyridine-2-carboxylate N-succinyltransferase
MPDLDALRSDIDRHAEADAPGPDARGAFERLLNALEAGEVRAAEKAEDGTWTANAWVKRGILLGFRLGEIVDQSVPGFAFFDKDTYPTQPIGLDRGVRVVPGGSTVRRGSYLAPGVVCMPPMYVNVGAYVGSGTMVDSHALVGSCGQIGERGVYEGTVVREGAVLAAGVILTRSTRVYDLANETVLRSSADAPLEIPAGAVVVPGSRAVGSDFGRQHGLSLSAPCIVKYRDASTDASTTLEDALR